MSKKKTYQNAPKVQSHPNNFWNILNKALKHVLDEMTKPTLKISCEYVLDG